MRSRNWGSQLRHPDSCETADQQNCISDEQREFFGHSTLGCSANSLHSAQEICRGVRLPLGGHSKYKPLNPPGRHLAERRQRRGDGHETRKRSLGLIQMAFFDALVLHVGTLVPATLARASAVPVTKIDLVSKYADLSGANSILGQQLDQTNGHKPSRRRSVTIVKGLRPAPQ